MSGRRTVGIVGWALCLLAWSGSGAILEAQPAYRVSPTMQFPGENGMEWVELGGLLYFTGYDLSHTPTGWGLFRTDGTEAGTVLVKDGIIPEFLTVMNGALYFAANQAGAGVELWRSDGTTAGTAMLLDIRPGTAGSDPAELTAVNNVLYFRAHNGTNGRELWKSDGTAAGTVLLKDTCIGCDGFAGDFTDLNGTVMFGAVCNGCGLPAVLWKTDGTTAGTVRVGTVTDVHELVVVNNTLFFLRSSSALWKSDGTDAGTVLVKMPDPSGTTLVHDLIGLGSLALFTASDGTNGEELWRSDGTAAGTVMVQALVPGNNSGFFTGPTRKAAANGLAYFHLDDTVSGMELWQTDGFSAGQVKDIDPGPGSSLGYANIDPTLTRPALYVHDCAEFGDRRQRCRVLTPFAGEAYFFAHDGTQGAELWKTDGTGAGTVRVQDIYPGPGPSGIYRTGIRLLPGRMYMALRGPTQASSDYSTTELWAMPTQPALIAGDLTVNEGSGGAVASVSVTVYPTSGGTVTVDYATANGTAVAGTDYAAVSGTLTFPPNTPTLTVNVSLTGDTVPELDKTFFLNLSNPTGAPIAKASAVVTIRNDDGASLSINDVTFGEAADAAFTVTLSAPSASPVSVDYITLSGSAVGGSDFTTSNGTVTFNAGQTSRPLTINVSDDTLDEAAENFFVELRDPTLAVIADGLGEATINDNDPPAAITISDINAPEGNSGPSLAIFTISVGPTTFPVSVDYATADGTATVADNDYIPLAGTLNFTPSTGGTALQVAVSLVGDTTDEDNETFFLNLSNAVNGTIADAQGLGTIIDGDTTSLSIINVSVTEGNGGPVTAAFTVGLSLPSENTVTVNYATTAVTATAGADYTAASGIVTFPPGTLIQPLDITVLGDTLDEANETFHVNLSGATGGATIGDPLGVGSILDDDPPPTISVDDVTVTEGDAGTVDAVFTVTLSAPSGQTVRVSRATANQTATAGSDYVALPSAQLMFAAGTTSQTVTVVVNGDTLGEPTETFALNLSSPVAATIADGQGVGTITNDDSPGLSVNNVTVTEGNSGTLNANFAVTLSPPAPGTVTVDYATADVTATAGSDYTATSGTLTFAAGVTTLPVTVPVIGDTLDEANETFNLDLSNPGGATLTDGQGVGTINDNDTATLAINNVTVTEGNSGTVDAVFNVTLSVATTQTVTVNYATADQTATAGADYVAASGTLTFTPGQTSQPVTVVVNGDTEVEGNHTFLVNLSGATGATISDPQGIGTITDDELPPTLSVDDVTVVEGNSGTVGAVFAVTLSFASAGTVTVNRATANLTATAGSDYVALPSAVLSFAAGETSKTVTVTVNGDTLFELDETFRLNLTAPVGATLADGQGQGTIQNDDGTFLYTLQPCRVADTRGPAGPSGAPALVANSTRNFPVTGRCLIPATAKAVVINVVAVNPGGLGNFRLYPFGGVLPTASVLNFAQGRTRANNAIIALGTNGQITVRNDTPGTTATTHFVLDVFGYFE